MTSEKTIAEFTVKTCLTTGKNSTQISRSFVVVFILKAKEEICRSRKGALNQPGPRVHDVNVRDQENKMELDNK